MSIGHLLTHLLLLLLLPTFEVLEQYAVDALNVHFQYTTFSNYRLQVSIRDSQMGRPIPVALSIGCLFAAVEKRSR